MGYGHVCVTKGKPVAGYSKRTLVEKLGIKAGQRTAILGAPRGYEGTLGALPAGVVVEHGLDGAFDFIHYFTAGRAELATEFPKLRRALKDSGALWVSWPKGASKVPTDLNENVVREIGLANGVVDVKVAAVDEVWSGLKFVVRVKDRG